ncbi:MAG: PDDEXK nuclease domain-containing protein [Candidatus Saganbacteria bacterium]|nr:PDDEXK nuclease domain-containing protein [Candidatus Saganbacteria bacterium]
MRKDYRKLIDSIGFLLEQARQTAFQAVNSVLVKTYWEIGRHIVVYEQKNKLKPEYGLRLLDNVSRDLKKRYGKGFSRSNIFNFRGLYLNYPKIQALPGFLSWTHIVSLISVENRLARSFYEKECIANRWSTRQLDRQINSMLFERLALSKDKKGVLKLASKGHKIEKPEDVLKNPYVLEFLGISENYKYSEKELEQKIIDNMQKFLLELGRGFSFVARQFRITLNNKHFYVDLVFYNIILKCFVLIDLKIGTITHQDIGQMNLYLNYFKKEELRAGDNEPIGIVLGADKDRVLVEYALGGISNKLFASKYRLSIPNKKLLEEAVLQSFDS